jgi:thiol-disulfide isomerase/thioredoxin
MNNINISNIENTKSRTIYTELSVATLKDILNNTEYKNKTLIIKFGATWCGPCKKIKDLCNKCFLQMSENVICFDIDIDENIEIFSALKTKKMVKGVPTILGYYCKNKRDQWYISDTSISGSDEKKVLEFFKNIYTQSQ